MKRFLSKFFGGSETNTNSNEIYKQLKKKEFNSGHLQYIIERIKGLEWPFNFSDDLIIFIAEESLKGRRSKDIANEVQKSFSHLTLNDVKSLALTVASIQSSHLTRRRAVDSGLYWYRWRTSEDGRVRKSHEKMHGVLVNWNDPPSPELLVSEKFIGYYHAGECQECRCYAEPVVDLKYIKASPLKVYVNGEIVKMTKTKFKELYFSRV